MIRASFKLLITLYFLHKGGTLKRDKNNSPDEFISWEHQQTSSVDPLVPSRPYVYELWEVEGVFFILTDSKS